jgi:TRAP-type C4-dicarboxylate transport system permease small subunit
MNTVLRHWKNIDLFISGCALILVIGLTLFGVVMRYCFNAPLPWLEEIQMLCIVWISMFGGSAVFRLGGHVVIELVIDLLGEGPRRAARIITFCIVIAVLCFIIYQGYELIIRLHQTGRTTSILRIPYPFIYSAVPIGGLLMLCSFITTEGRELFPSGRAETGGQVS